MLRPFWLHQAAEYLVGLVLVAMGLQTLEPTVPVLAGALVLLNAALVDGPLGAWRVFDRRTHRIVDLVVIGVLLLGAVIPVLGVDATGRATLAVGAVVLAVVWWNSAFETRATGRGVAAAPVAEPKANRSETIGRGAGRVAGNVAKAIRDRQKPS